MKLIFIIFSFFAMDLISQGKDNLTSPKQEELSALEVFKKMSDIVYLRRQSPWSSHGSFDMAKFWQKIPDELEAFKNSKFEILHRKIDQRAFLYLINNKKRLKDFEKTPCEKKPLALLIRDVYYHLYSNNDSIDLSTRLIASKLKDPLVKEMCMDSFLYKHINLNGMQLPKAIGEARDKASAKILMKVSEWIVTTEKFFFHKSETLESIIIGAMNLEKSSALLILKTLKNGIEGNLRQEDPLRNDALSYITLLRACEDSLKKAEKKPLVVLMESGNKASYRICLSLEYREAIPHFLEKYPYRDWMEVNNFLRMGDDAKKGLDQAIQLNDWRKVYFRFLLFAIEKPEEYKKLRRVGRIKLSNKLMDLVKFWDESSKEIKDEREK